MTCSPHTRPTTHSVTSCAVSREDREGDPDLLQHRGGFSTTNPRVLATVTYSSSASLASLTERSYEFAGSVDELDSPTRFALS